MAAVNVIVGRGRLDGELINACQGKRLHTAPEPFENFSHVYDAENFQHSRKQEADSIDGENKLGR